jgi:thioredoxin-dependent peroxiredoxin
MLKENDSVPTNITLKDINDRSVTLEQFLGKYLVIYFYPKDDTPGCTVEACQFRDFNNDIKDLGAKVIGISKDKVKSHSKFINKYSLNFTLLSDENHELQDAFGVWGEKKMMGRTFMGTRRMTFLADPKGKIIKIWENVKAEGHAKEVYEFIKGLKGKS